MSNPAALARKLFGGLGDFAFASLCTFAVGLAAVRGLPNEGVALFSLLLTGYIVGMLLPRQLMLTHIEVSVNQDDAYVVPHLRDSIRRAAVPLALAATVAVSAGAPVWPHVTPAEYFAMAIGAGLSAVTGSLLAHVRALYHVVEAHEWAGISSMVNFIAVISTLAIFWNVQGPAHYALPFGALAFGQIVALGMWPLVTRRRARGGRAEVAGLASRLLYLVPVSAGQLAIYAQSTLVVSLLGTAESAHLEGARVAASPVYIVASGLAAFLMPPLVRKLGKSPSRSILIGLLIGMAVVAATGFMYAIAVFVLGAHLSSIFGRSIDPALAGSRAGAFALEGSSTLPQGLFVVLQEFVRPALVSVGAALLSVAATFATISEFGVFAVPFGHAVSAVCLWLGGVYITTSGLKSVDPGAPDRATKRGRHRRPRGAAAGA